MISSLLRAVEAHRECSLGGLSKVLWVSRVEDDERDVCTEMKCSEKESKYITSKKELAADV